VRRAAKLMSDVRAAPCDTLGGPLCVTGQPRSAEASGAWLTEAARWAPLGFGSGRPNRSFNPTADCGILKREVGV
jgi:hypothetical protein